MKRFKYFAPETVEEAVSLLQEHGAKAVLNAGGTDLLGVLKDWVLPEQPEVVVNLKSIPNMDYIEEDGGVLKIGALATLQDICTSATVKNKYAALCQAAKAVGATQLRNMGTIGGNICQETRCMYWRLSRNYFFCLRKGGLVCYAQTGNNRFGSIFGGPTGCYSASPSDTAPALIALNASLMTSKRTIAIEEFFTNDAPGHVLDSDEVLTEIQVPEPAANSKQAFRKARIRKAIDFALASAAVVITPSTGTITDARVALGRVAPKPIRSTAAEDALKGNTISENVAENAALAAVAGSIPLDLNAYKVALTQGVVKQAILA